MLNALVGDRIYFELEVDSSVGFGKDGAQGELRLTEPFHRMFAYVQSVIQRFNSQFGQLIHQSDVVFAKLIGLPLMSCNRSRF